MSLGFKSNRSRSTSNILDRSIDDKESSISLLSTSALENPYRTYTFKDLSKSKLYPTEDAVSFLEKRSESTKSQSFIKKLVASLEKRNESCKANDEFLSRYYKNDDGSSRKKINLITDSGSENVPLRVDINSHNEVQKIDPLCANKSSRKPCNREINADHAFANFESDSDYVRDQYFDHGGLKGLRSFGKDRLSLIDPRVNRKRFETTFEDEDERRFHSISFDLERSSVMIRDRLHSTVCNSLLENHDNYMDNNYDEISIEPAREDINYVNTPDKGLGKKKVVRKRSFKNIIGSMIKWRKSAPKEKPRRFMSYDDLIENKISHKSGNTDDLSRAASLQAVSFQDCEKQNLLQETTRNAVIHPVYGAKRSDRVLSAFNSEGKPIAKPEETEFTLENNKENFLRPSLVKTAARRLSLFPEEENKKSKKNQRGLERRNSAIEKESYPKKIFLDEFYENSSTRSIDRQLRNEYSSILTNRM